MTKSDMSTAGLEQKTRRNMKRSQIIVFAAFSTNAGLNFFLLGVLARQGGLELVGHWAFLNAIQSTMLIADFGVTNALTFRIGRDGVPALEPVLRAMMLIGAVTVGLSLLLALLGRPLGDILTPVMLTAAAGGLQLGSNWLIAIRMGQHEQYWFNVKTVLRVIIQTVLALSLLRLFSDSPMTAFSWALLSAGAIEALFAAGIVRGQWRLRGPLARGAALQDLVRGFGLLSLSMRGLQPLSQLIVSAMAGASVLGVFTVAARAPIVISQSVSEALRALLPGLARMTDLSERARVHTLLADGMAGQIVLVFPALSALAIHAPLVFAVWLGESTASLELALLVLAVGVFVACLSVPHFWALQALDATVSLSRLTFARVAISLGLGALLLALLGSALVMPMIYAVSVAAGSAIVFWLSHARFGLFLPCLAHLHWGRIAVYMAGALVLNIGLARWPLGSTEVLQLGVIALVNMIALGPVALWITKHRAFSIRKGHDHA